MRIGIGYDIHPVVADRRLMLGGVEIPCQTGLAGHSDGDVLLHAIIDALLGASAQGDIGKHFPPGDPQYKDIASLVLLRRTINLLASNRWQIGNIDATIVAESPKLLPFIEDMRNKIAKALDINPGQVSVKAKTANKVGHVGSGEAMEAYATALLFQESKK
ncbi:MAG: 2-C-methyl-D-erythritol 2,4-cyclodiphosphate synthase [Chloroflexi bacterium]|nr:2-C-methyl-D-erythritol 2,4-cyclodiphosphate synthase [Chloroflexota bacterium]